MICLNRFLALAGVGVCLLATLEAQVDPPTFAPSSSDSAVKTSVVVDCATVGVDIHYTLNGEEPTTYDPLIPAGSSLIISKSGILKAAAWLGADRSTTTTADYRITGSITLGELHGLAMSTTGKVWSWGHQGSGRLGNGVSSATTVDSPTPVINPVDQLDTGMAIAGGYTHSHVVDQSGEIWSFGQNNYGQLGNNQTTSSTLPLKVLRSTTVGDYFTGGVLVDAGRYFSVALDENGGVHSWGVGWDGRLGSGGGTFKYARPVERGDDPANPPLTGIIDIEAGLDFGIAMEPSALAVPGGTGKVWVWGKNDRGQLGQGNTSNLSRAVPMMLDATTEMSDAWDVAAAMDHTVVVRWKTGDANLQGSVWTCGYEAYGRLGNGNVSWNSIKYPVQVIKEDTTPLDGILQVASSSIHTLAVDQNGNVWSWGWDHHGALGRESTWISEHAGKVRDPAGTGYLEDIVMVAAGGEGVLGTSMALASDGTIYAWGKNDYSQSGSGSGGPTAIHLPIVQGGNYVDEGEPSVSLSHAITTTEAPHDVDLTAIPAHTGVNGVGHIVSVEFFLNGSSVGVLTTAPWTVSVVNAGTGPQHAFAIVTDDQGLGRGYENWSI